MLEHTNTDALPHWGQSTHPVLTVSVNPCWIQICLWSVIFCGEAGHDLYSKGCPDTPTTPSANQREDCHHRVRTSLSSLSLSSHSGVPSVSARSWRRKVRPMSSSLRHVLLCGGYTWIIRELRLGSYSLIYLQYIALIKLWLVVLVNWRAC